MTDIGTAPTDPVGFSAADETTIIRPGGFGSPVTGAPISGGRVYSTGFERPEAGSPPADPAGGDAASRGRTTIADEVVEQVINRIVDLAIEEAPGVRGLHRGGAAGEPVSVRLEGERAELDIAVDLEFGHPVHDAVQGLRSALIGSAERLLGLAVAEVNVLVAGVAFDPPDGQAAPEASG